MPELRPTSRPRLPEAAAFVLPLLLYFATLAPTVTLEDSGEFITAAYHLGVPHPSGYPLWCLLAHPFTWLRWGSVAQRVHLSSAFFAAVATWLTYRVALRLAGDSRAALVAALGLAVSPVLWSQSIIAEVYALNALLTILLVELALRWRDERRTRWMYALALAVGLGLGNHPLLVLAALPIFAWLLVVDLRALLRARIALGGALLLALGMSVYLYLPLRAANAPPLNIGNPSTLARTIVHMRRDLYFRPTEAGRTAGDARAIVRHTVRAWQDSVHSFGWPLAAVAVLGIFTWPRGGRDVLVVTLAIALANTLLLNMMLTAPYARLWVYLHRVYYIPMHAMAALWLAAGAATLLRAAMRQGVWLHRLASLLLAALVGGHAYAGLPEIRQQGSRVAENLALDLLDSAPPQAGFLPIGDEVLYPVLWARHVAGLRPDVNLLSEEYGWRRQPYSMLLAADAINDQLRADLPVLRDYAAVPYGLVYALVPRSEATRDDRRSFVPLPHPPRDAGLEHAGDDLFVAAVRARYAAYYARLGALQATRGERAAAHASFDRAETLDPGDAHVELLLFEVYRELGIRRERWRPLLERALEHFDRDFEPHGARYDTLTRAAIEQNLRSLEHETSAAAESGTSTAGGARRP